MGCWSNARLIHSVIPDQHYENLTFLNICETFQPIDLSLSITEPARTKAERYDGLASPLTRLSTEFL